MSPDIAIAFGIGLASGIIAAWVWSQPTNPISAYQPPPPKSGPVKPPPPPAPPPKRTRIDLRIEPDQFAEFLDANRGQIRRHAEEALAPRPVVTHDQVKAAALAYAVARGFAPDDPRVDAYRLGYIAGVRRD